MKNIVVDLLNYVVYHYLCRQATVWHLGGKNESTFK